MSLRFPLYVCFFISGASALVYQVVWQRMLTLVFGLSTMSVAAVLSAFLAGLALGARWFGPWVDCSRNPVRSYAFIELGIVAAGLASGFLVDPLMDAFTVVHRALEPGWFLSNLIRFALAFVGFGLPSVLLGATVPAMARLVSAWEGSIAAGFSRFYAINTCGSVAGAVGAGFFLLRLVGVQTSLYVAIAGNLLAGLLALSLARRSAAESAAPDATSPDLGDAKREASHPTFALVGAMVTGALGLAYEVAWMRLLSVYTLNSVYVFAMVVSLYLAALAIGTALAGILLRRTRLNRVDLLAGVQMLLALYTPVLLFALPRFADVGITNRALTESDIFVREFLLSAAIVFLPTVLIGMTLPLLVAMFGGGVTDAGRTVGRIYAWNSVGTILGAAATGVVLVPLVGLRSTLLLLAVGNFLIMGWATAVQPADTRVRRAAPIAGAVTLVFLVVLAPPTTRFYRKVLRDLDERVVFYAEGPSATVHVAEVTGAGKPYLQLYVDSQGVAGTYPEIVIDQKMIGHLPQLLHPNPQRAMTVGFGTGGSSYSALLHGIEVETVEIEPRVPEAAPLFESENLGWVGAGKVRNNFTLVIDDARARLQVTPYKYDSILTDMISIQYRGNGNLYTTDFFELMRDRLTPDGLACAWVPIDGVSPEQLKILVRSFRSVFEHTSIWYMLNLPTDFVFLVAAPERLAIDMEQISTRMQRPMIARDLAKIDLVNPYQLLACLLLAEEDVAAYVGDGPVHTDDRPILDYLTHASRYMSTLHVNLEEMLAHRRDPSQYVTRWPKDAFAGLPQGRSADGTPLAWQKWNEAAPKLLNGHIAVVGNQDMHGWQNAQKDYQAAADLLPDDPLIANLLGS